MPAIKRYFLEQPAMLLSPMSALKRIADSTRTSRHVRNAPQADSCTAANWGQIREGKPFGACHLKIGFLAQRIESKTIKDIKLSDLAVELHPSIPVGHRHDPD